MKFLAIDSSTDALSLALGDATSNRCIHRVLPRQHQQQLFAFIDELCEGQELAALGLDALVYGRGPGSFTGLRITVSAIQGLAFSLGLPVVGVSSLETQARTLLRREDLREPCTIVSTIDARIGQLYVAWYGFDGSELAMIEGAVVASAEALTLPGNSGLDISLPVFACGSGCGQLAAAGELPPADRSWPDLLPESQDMLAPAARSLAAGDAAVAGEAQPDYVQTRIGWKTLAEQGRKA